MTEARSRDYWRTCIAATCRALHGARQARQALLGPLAARVLQDRVPVTVQVERVVAWPDRRLRGRAAASAARRCRGDSAGAQEEPGKGAGPRVDCERAATRLARLPTPAGVHRRRRVSRRRARWTSRDSSPAGIRLAPNARCRPPAGARGPAGPQLPRAADRALESRRHTGWLSVGERGARGALRPAHRDGLPGAAQQDAAAARERLDGQAGPTQSQAPRKRPSAAESRLSLSSGPQGRSVHVRDRLDRDHRVDARGGRERRAVADVEVAHVPGLARAGCRPSRRASRPCGPSP